MEERVLTLRELNRALLARQLLLRRQRLPIAGAIERVGALQAQWPPSPYIALWSRLDGFERDAMTRALARRRVVKATLMRVTLHLVSARDYSAYARLYLDRARSSLGRHDLGIDIGELAKRAEQLAAERPRSRPELLSILGLERLRPLPHRPWLVWYVMQAHAALIHAPESARWRLTTGRTSFVPARTWLGHQPSADVAHLVRRYLAAFGPASRADASQWTGLPVAVLARGFDALRLRRFRDERGRELYDLLRAPLPRADAAAPARLLPMWDSTLLAHEDRTRILPEEYRRVVIKKNGDVQPTFLVDGFVAGVWRLENGRIELEPFERLSRDVERELRTEADGLARFHD